MTIHELTEVLNAIPNQNKEVWVVSEGRCYEVGVAIDTNGGCVIPTCDFNCGEQTEYSLTDQGVLKTVVRSEWIK